MIVEMASRNRSRRQVITAGIMLIMTITVLIALTSCSVLKLIEDDEQDAAVADVDEAKLNCSEECMDRGQCGVDEKGDEYILLASSSPSLDDHDLIYKSDTHVNILNRENHSVVQHVDGKTFDMSFYNVALPEGGQAWVAGWCLEN
jgi:hypothetical protein